MASENQICIGIRPKRALKKYNLIPTLIHELIHVNTYKTKFKQKLFYKRDSEEIVTALYTIKIVRDINTRFNMHIPEQKLTNPFLNLEKFIPQLEEFLNQSKS